MTQFRLVPKFPRGNCLSPRCVDFCSPHLAEEAHLYPRRSVHIFLFSVFVLLGSAAQAQSNEPSDALFKTVQSLDTQLFDAYNHCDLTKLGAMVSDDLEFYHDKTGLSVGKALFIAAIKQNICGKVERRLVAGSFEVYPLKDYGAVEIGVHRFTILTTRKMAWERPSS